MQSQGGFIALNKTSTALRGLLARPGAIVSAGVYDALSARIAEMAGFEAVHHSGYGTAASVLAQPDVGLLDFSEMCRQVKNISRSVSIPVLGDADTGYGNALNTHRTVREYVWAGAAGTFLEDQQWPKRCGHMAGKAVIPWEEMAGKLRSAIDARDAEDRDFVLIYRTDALAVNGFEDALDRAKRARDLGVDMIFVEALETVEQMERVVAEVDAPLMLNLIEGGRTPLVSAEEGERMGFKYIVFALSALYAAASGMLQALKEIRKTGRCGGSIPTMSFADFAEIVNVKGIEDLEQRYVSGSELNKRYHGKNRIV